MSGAGRRDGIGEILLCDVMIDGGRFSYMSERARSDFCRFLRNNGLVHSDERGRG